MKNKKNTLFAGSDLLTRRLCRVLVLLFLVCGKVMADGQEPLRVGVYENPPLVYYDEQGAVQGFIPDLLEYIAERQGWRLQYVPCEWLQCKQLLAAEEIDLLAPVAVSTTRLQRFDFNRENLFINWGQIYARRPGMITSIPDLNGKSVAVVIGDTHYARLRELAERYEITIDFHEYPAYDTVLAAVSRGETDAGLVNRLYASRNGDSFLAEKTAVIFNPVGLRIALPIGKHGNQELVSAMDVLLGKLKSDPDSYYYQALERWLSDDYYLGWPRWPRWLGWLLAIGIGLSLLLGIGSLILRGLVRRRTQTLKLEIERRVRSEEEEQALGVLLRLSLERLDLEVYLQQVIDSLLGSVPWLDLLPQAGIFLADESGNSEVLQLVASHNMAPELKTLCARVPFGKCLCGQAALSRRTLFASCVDDCHEIHFEGMRDHGHYNVPILSNDQVLGVIVTYVPHGHMFSAHEQAFLEQVADVLSMGICRRRDARAIEHLAYYDPLTGLANRRMLLDRLQHDMMIAARHAKQGAVLFLDLDRFKTLNDSLGHTVGDALLCQVAERLTNSVRAEDTVARLGGDEFVIILPELSEDSRRVLVEVRSVAEKLRSSLAEPFELDGHQYRLTASIGIDLFPKEHEQAVDILRHADTAMYWVKGGGRDGARFFEPGMQAKADARLELENQLRFALERKQLHLHYQPQMDMAGNIVGAEVLLRWMHPDWGAVPPSRFVPVAEEAGLIFPIGEWVLRSACEQLKDWMTVVECEDHMRGLSINVSPIEFRQTDFVAKVGRIFEETGVDASRITLEITEGTLVDDIDETIVKMQGLRQYGVHLSIDDFGTGYSSLAYLKRMPLNRLKIDRSFIRDICTEPNDAAIVDTILAISAHLDMETVAEGVESKEQLDFLVERNCLVYQGNYFSKPIPAAAFQQLVCTAGVTGVPS